MMTRERNDKKWFENMRYGILVGKNTQYFSLKD